MHGVRSGKIRVVCRRCGKRLAQEPRDRVWSVPRIARPDTPPRVHVGDGLYHARGETAANARGDYQGRTWDCPRCGVHEVVTGLRWEAACAAGRETGVIYVPL